MSEATLIVTIWAITSAKIVALFWIDRWYRAQRDWYQSPVRQGNQSPEWPKPCCPADEEREG